MVELYRCTKCGHWNPPGREACFLCKRDLTGSVPSEPAREPTEGKAGESKEAVETPPSGAPAKKRRWGPIVAVVAVLAVVGALALFLWPRGSGEGGEGLRGGLGFGSSDTQGPVLQSSEPAASAVVAPGAVMVRGGADEPLAAARVDGAEAAVAGQDFELEVQLEEGPATLRIELEDESGNTATHELVLDVVAVPEGLSFLEWDAAGRAVFGSDRAPGLALVKIAGGTFDMGSSAGDSDETPVHQVTVSPFLIARTETTNAQWRSYVDAGEGSAPADPGWGGDFADYFESQPDGPVVNIDWNGANAFCEWLGLRLPTEAEWEFAAVGTTGATYPWGDVQPNEGGVWRAVYDPADDGYRWTAPVGSLPDGDSPFGISDMAGNVWEWTNDGYGRYPSGPAVDPRADGGTKKVLRGGSWTSNADSLRSANRWNNFLGYESAFVGFRCASGS